MERQSKEPKLPLQGSKRRRVYALTEIALMSAVFCVLAPIAMPVPFSPVPITFGTFVLYLTAVLLGCRKGTAAVFLYLLIGLAGLPVFSGFTAGFTKLLGPGGGYMIGYLPAVFLMGRMAQRRTEQTAHRRAEQTAHQRTEQTAHQRTHRRRTAGKSLAAAGIFVCGAAVCYTFGTVWFLVMMSGTYTVFQALLVCVVPFLPFEIIKIILAAAIALPVKQLLHRAGIPDAEEYL